MCFHHAVQAPALQSEGRALAAEDPVVELALADNGRTGYTGGPVPPVGGSEKGEDGATNTQLCAPDSPNHVGRAAIAVLPKP
jgi:hypothetical protein